jgi:hypothetical protein
MQENALTSTSQLDVERYKHMTYEQQTISIKVEGAKGEVAEELKEEAVVAVGSGLAYFAQTGRDGKVRYSVTHINSGLHVCRGWYATSEQQAQAWIASLQELADWTGEMPHIRVSLATMMRYAIIGVLHEAPRLAQEET